MIIKCKNPRILAWGERRTGSENCKNTNLVVENGPNTLILCNQMNYTGVGLQLTGNNLKTRVQKNVFDHTVLGVKLRDAVMSNQGSVTSPNTSYFNEWRNNYTSLDWGSRIQGNIIASEPINWTYSPYTNDLIPCDYGIDNPCDFNVTSSPTSNQFSIIYVDVNSFECTSPIPGIISYSERFDPWIDGDTLFSNQDSSGLRFLFRQNAMIELNQDSLLWTMSDSLTQKYRD